MNNISDGSKGKYLVIAESGTSVYVFIKDSKEEADEKFANMMGFVGEQDEIIMAFIVKHKHRTRKRTTKLAEEELEDEDG